VDTGRAKLVVSLSCQRRSPQTGGVLTKTERSQLVL